MKAYYNENDPFAAAWLRELMSAGLITPGDVDERPIQDVQTTDLSGYDRVHLFAGIGGWELALNLAGWGSRQVWTGSCPCQPFSAAGRQKGTKDARHLWPWMRHLVFRWRPAIAFGEQVASGLGREWLAGVRANLEALGYAVGAADLCAAGVGAPHIRQRLWWVADANSRGRDAAGERGRLVQVHGRTTVERGAAAESGSYRRVADASEPGRGRPGRSSGTSERAEDESRRLRDAGGLAVSEGGTRRPGADERTRLQPCVGGGVGDSAIERRQGRQSKLLSAGQAEGRLPAGSSSVGGLAESNGGQSRHGHLQPGRQHGQQPENGGTGFWGRFDLIPCRDGKARRVEPGTFPLAHGIPRRVGKLRGYGNAICPQAGAAFVTAFLEASPSPRLIDPGPTE